MEMMVPCLAAVMQACRQATEWSAGTGLVQSGTIGLCRQMMYGNLVDE